MDDLLWLLRAHWLLLLGLAGGAALLWYLRRLWQRARLELEAIDRAERMQREVYQRERRWVERDGRGPE